MVHFFLATILMLYGAAAYAVGYWDTPDSSQYAYNLGTLPQCDFTITQNADWDQVNNTAYRVICVAPGDYSAYGSGRVTLSASGTSTARRWLRYFDPAHEVGDSVHPYAMPAAKRVVLNSLWVTGDYWIIDRITSKDHNREFNKAAILFQPGATYNVLSRPLIYNMSAGVSHRGAASHNITQYAVMHSMRNGTDGVCWMNDGVNLPADNQPQYNWLIGSELIDCSDGVINANNSSGVTYIGDHRGVFVYDNDIYATSSIYRDCSTADLSPTGECSCLENAFDIKAGTLSTTEPIRIVQNRVWGSRPMPATNRDKCGQADTEPNFDADFNYQLGGGYIVFEGNIFTDTGGVVIATNTETSRDVKLLRNLIHKQFTKTDTAYTPRAVWHAMNGAVGNEITGNVLSQTGVNGTTSQGWYFTQVNAGSNNSVTDNALILSPRNSDGGTFTGWTISGNTYVESDKPTWDSGATSVATAAGSAWDNDLCFWRKKITAPERACLDYSLHDSNVVAPPTGPAQPSKFRISD